MSKEIFRYLRGELNGFYIQNIHQAWNEYIKDIKAFFIYFNNMQTEEGKISDEDLNNLGIFAGTFFPLIEKSEQLSNLRMTESHIVDGNEYSERGLFDTVQERFDFVHTSDPQSTDINTLATDTERSSLVGDEAVQGYISSEETDVLDDEGKVKPEKVLASPPDVAYSNFYGNQFLFLAEGNISYETLDSALFLALFKTMQWIRYNGISVASLVELITIICPEGLVKIQSINVAPDNVHYDITYVFDNSVDILHKQQRLLLFKYVMNIKFPQVTLIEV